jgi:hypothetical protein
MHTPGTAWRGASTFLILVSALAALTGVGRSVAHSQDETSPTAQIQALRQEISVLRQVNRMGLTGDQRLQAARIIAAYAGQRETLTGPADPEALIDALVVVKDALLGGAEPTPEMWQALQAAQTQNVDDPEQALAPLRTRAVADLVQLLTEEQKAALATPPTEELSQAVLGQLAALRRLPEGQRENALAEALGAISRQVAPFTTEANLPQIQAAVADFAARLGNMAPQQAQQQRGQLLQELADRLAPLLTAGQSPQQRLEKRVAAWLDNPTLLTVLEESGQAMTAR